MPKNDIENLEDIQLLVDDFYGRVREHDMLKDIFNDVLQDRWPHHIEKMYKFWQTILLGEHTYQGTPFLPHAQLPVEEEHFDEWIITFNKTVDDHFQGTRAEKAKWQGARMAQMFLSKIRYYRNNSSIPLI